jgi:hypothetical protein
LDVDVQLESLPAFRVPESCNEDRGWNHENEYDRRQYAVSDD